MQEHSKEKSSGHPLLRGFARFLGGPLFPTFSITVLLGFALLILYVVVVPSEDGDFASEFKRWCFAWDGVSDLAMMRVVMMASELLVFSAILLGIWWGPLKDGLKTARRKMGFAVLLGGLTLGFAIFALVASEDGVPPINNIEALRTEKTLPHFRLIDQNGAVVDTDDYRGKVLLITAIYATCGDTCPMLFGQAQDMVKDIQDSEDKAVLKDLQVLAITLDPEYDTEAVRKELAQRRNLEAPLWKILGGEPRVVESALDRLEIARKKNEKTGQINHANVFILVDKDGKLAYRLALSEKYKLWLKEATLSLLKEEKHADRSL